MTHGAPYTYLKLGCRCPDCTAAAELWQRQQGRKLAAAVKERIRAVDAHVAELKAMAAPDQPAQWERLKADRDALQARVAALEGQLDDMIDAVVKPKRGRGRPRKTA